MGHSAPTLSDEELMARIGAGDEQAFALLVKRHTPLVIGLAFRRLGQMADAEEASQEVFATIWRKAGDWQSGQAQFTTWLYRVTVNKCTDMRRRRKPATPLDDVPEPVSEAEDGLDIMSKKSDRKLIFQALNKLSEAQRQAIELVYFAEMEQKEAAKALDVTLAALESSLRRGREKLRKALKGQFPDRL